MIDYESNAKVFTNNIDYLEELGYELYQERNAYPKEIYDVKQLHIDNEINDYIECIHMIMDRASYQGITLSTDVVMYLQERNTNSKNLDNCKICKCNIDNGIHYTHHYNKEHLLTINDC